MENEDAPVDPHTLLWYKPTWPPSDLTDFSKLNIRDGKIHYFLYQQDGTKQSMSLPDTYDNRLYVSWFQMHDRH